MTEEDDWITAAMADHTLVAHLLMKLNQAPPPQPSNNVSAPALPLDWSVKQRRTSKQQQAFGKKADATLASPTTPLSWSGGGTSVSFSASDGGFEESKAIYATRSEVAVASDTPMTKRSRKRKTLLELREEECLLLKERSNLKNQLETLRFTVEKERDANERLKRLKVDLLSRQTPETASTADKTEENDSIKQIKVPFEPTSLITTTIPTRNKLEPLSPSGCLQKREVKGLSSFVLPDLNLPVDENSDSNILCGIS